MGLMRVVISPCGLFYQRLKTYNLRYYPTYHPMVGRHRFRQYRLSRSNREHLPVHRVLHTMRGSGFGSMNVSLFHSGAPRVCQIEERKIEERDASCLRNEDISEYAACCTPPPLVRPLARVAPQQSPASQQSTIRDVAPAFN